MPENNILQTIVEDSQKEGLRLDSYIELLHTTYGLYKNMITHPEGMLTRILKVKCDCGNNEMKGPQEHSDLCSYRQLYGI